MMDRKKGGWRREGMVEGKVLGVENATNGGEKSGGGGGGKNERRKRGKTSGR